MKTTVITFAIASLALCAAPAQVPSILNYQGRVTVGGTNLTTNAALFKFALVDGSGSTVYWKNDGSVTANEPATAVTTAVAQGLYSILLGDTSLANMAAIPASVFTNSDVNLRVWFSPGSGTPFVQLSPDQRIGASGYALRAASAAEVDIPGDNNTASGVFAVVGGGSQNTASGQSATIGGGFNNGATNSGATVAGGGRNMAGGYASFVGGGIGNTASGESAVVGGGLDNTNIAYAATIAGGQANTNSADTGSIGGGYLNNISDTGINAVIGGGDSNTASGVAATIGGGADNTNSANYATVGGGVENTASGYSATIGGGLTNAASGGYSVVGGGETNTASGNRATIGGGSQNTAAGAYATVPGGVRSFATDFGSFVWGGDPFEDTSSFGNNTFTVRAEGGVRFYTANGTATGVNLSAGAGAWNNLSDREAKANFRKVDATTVLAKVAAMPVMTWNYRTQDESIRHIGPTAQDFRAAFGLGENDKTISTIDPSGVALAAIQGLVEELKLRDKTIEELKAKLDAVEQRLESFPPGP